MSKTPTLVILTLAVVTAAVAVPAVHKYTTTKVQAVSKTVQAVNYHAKYEYSQEQVKNLTTSNGTLQATATQLTTQNGQLCADLKSRKVTEPLCN